MKKERAIAMKKAKGNKRRLGERLVAEFSELRDALRAKRPVENRHMGRKIKTDRPAISRAGG